MGWNAGYAAMEESVIAVYDGIGALPRLAIESCCAKPVLVYLERVVGYLLKAEKFCA